MASAKQPAAKTANQNPAAKKAANADRKEQQQADREERQAAEKAAEKEQEGTEPTEAEEAASKISTPQPLRDDARFPEIHPSKHSADGLQERNTAAAPADLTQGEPAGGGAGSMQASFDPNPLIGITRSGEPGTAKIDVEALQAQDYVWSLEQALSLPVEEDGGGSGGATSAPSGEQLKSLRKKMAEQQVEDSFEETGDEKEDAKQRAKALKAAEKGMENRFPVVAFKDKYRRTLVVSKGKDGLVARPSKDYAEVEIQG